MGYVYICMQRTDIPEGVLQVTDMWPNVSQRNGSLDPPGQTKYFARPQNDTVAVSSNVTSAQYQGLAAYILDCVEDGTTNNALSAADANDMADAIIANLLDTIGGEPTSANVDAELNAIVAGTSLTGGSSVASLRDVLAILAGAEYTVPAGTSANTGAAFKAAAAGSFTAIRNIYDTGAFQISFGDGQLATFCSADFEYGTRPANVAANPSAALVVFANDGTLYTL
jgi:hypothetical protein